MKTNVTLFLCAFYHNLFLKSLNNSPQSISRRYVMPNLLFEESFKTWDFISNYRETFQFGEGYLWTGMHSNEENFVTLCWFSRDDFDCVYGERQYGEITAERFLVQIDLQVHYESFLTFFCMEITIKINQFYIKTECN